MARKTVDVSTVLTFTNNFLANLPGDDDAARNQRRGAATILESILFQTETYGGFQYIGGYSDAPDFDDTRRIYYISHSY